MNECKICKTILYTPKIFLEHLNSPSHHLMEINTNLGFINSINGSRRIKMKDINNFKCKICDKIIKSPSNYTKHTATKKHQKKLLETIKV